MKCRSRIAASAGLLATLACVAPALAAPDPGDAAQLFAEAKAICTRDEGRLWGQSLCGPMLLVDYTDRKVIANQADAQGRLIRDGDLFEGVLPDDVIIANTPTEWAGTRWTQLIAPVTPEPMNRHVTRAHELFHRIQSGLGLTRPEAGNRHLDTLEGRYLLQLEWRALARALGATAPEEQREAVTDALSFRRERDRLFPAAAVEEGALEINEGIPEYTGVILGLETSQERTAYAIYDLSRFVRAPTFVRSFAYATGPAYGLLLDRLAPGWRTGLRGGPRLDELLAAAVNFHVVELADVATRERRYDEEGSLQESEKRRDRDRQAMLADYKGRLVEGPVLLLPRLNANYQFNPQTLIPLEDIGTIYPKLGLSDEWGTLEVDDGGALVHKKGGNASVPAHGIAPDHLAGPGWRLSLKPGWTVRSGARLGDFEVAHTASSKAIPRPQTASPK